MKNALFARIFHSAANEMPPNRHFTGFLGKNGAFRGGNPAFGGGDGGKGIFLPVSLDLL